MAKTDVKAPATKTASDNGKAKTAALKADISVAEKLVELYRLQHVDSQVDRIKVQRGELPLEVQDLEDEVAGLETRLNKLQDELAEVEGQVNDRQNMIKEAKAQIDGKKSVVEDSRLKHDERKKDLELKKKELDDIIAETEKEEKELQKKSDSASKHIEERLLSAYHRIRSNARNGLAVVAVERGSCGGCFNSIPPQRQLDISSHKKIIVCEHCGRILVDDHVVERVMGEK